MHRFFIVPELLKTRDMPVSLPENLAHQVRDVLHLAVGEQIILLDNSGDEVVCAISRFARKEVEVDLLERRRGKPESSVHITLCQGLLKSARFEWILEKGTEMGVAAFAPTLCRRCIGGLEDAGPAKLQRWQRIIQEATEQCGRARLPELLPIRPLMQVLNDIPAGSLAVIPWEEERGQSLRDMLRAYAAQASQTARTATKERDPLHVFLFIGPEGGLLVDEIRLAQRHGVQVVTLGPRTLRAETAALAATANVMYELEQS